jgi:tetratricopeptide (TPR) repeat protein/transcriptional regulator with XRE-family HTH domain
MTALLRWSGREARLLREAMRMSVREFAAHLGYNDAAVSSWERRGENTRLRAQTQRDLDAALRLAGDETRDWFHRALHVVQVPPAAEPAADAEPGTSPDRPADRTQSLTVHVGPDDLVVRLDRQAMRHPQVGVVVDALVARALAGEPDVRAGRAVVASATEIDQIVDHLREQWHALVRTDNLLGPRHALAAVHTHLAVLADLLPATRGALRTDLLVLAARYGESAAWLHEDAGDLAQARTWISRAADWAREAADPTMLAWTAYRRSHLAMAAGDAGATVGLARAARRGGSRLAGPLRTAARVQEALGRALDGEESAALRLLDRAYEAATDDQRGDARGGHGSFCTPAYVQSARATCLTLLGRVEVAVACYESAIPRIPVVYPRDRAAALAGKAAAHLAAGEPELAAATAHAALPVARLAGSRRILTRVTSVGSDLAPYRRSDQVAAFLAELAEAG